MACNRGFSKQKYDIWDIRDINQKARYNENYIKSETLLLVGAKLSFYTREIFYKDMRLKAIDIIRLSPRQKVEYLFIKKLLA